MALPNTHINTRQIRLPVRTHRMLALLAERHGFTSAAMADIAVEWFCEKYHHKGVLSDTAGLPEPRRRLPTFQPIAAKDPMEGTDVRTRQARVPLRTHARLMAFAKTRRVFLATILEDILETYMAQHPGTETILEEVAGLPEPSRTIPRGEIIAAVPAETGEIIGAAAQ